MDIAYYVAASLDGYIAGPDGGIDWLAPFETPREDYGYAAFYAGIDAVVLGRRTYELSLSFDEWPYAGKRVWVLSRTLPAAETPQATVTAASPREVAAAMENAGLRRAWLVGGGETAGAFRAAGLITEYIVSVIPVVLGGGVPLFAANGPREQLILTSSEPYDNGLVQLRYLRLE